jgi:anti-sigma factor RsiW
MNCRGVLDALSDYLEGDAGSTVCEKIEEHLRGCERCRMHIDTMRKMITLYKRWRDEPIPEDVKMRLQTVFTRECVLKGVDRAAAPRSRGASAASPGSKTGKTRASRGKRKPAARKQAKSPKRAPRKR